MINKTFSNRGYKKESLPSHSRAKATASGAPGTLARASLAAWGRAWRQLQEAELTLEKGIRICQEKEFNQNRPRLMKRQAETLERALKWKGKPSLLCWETLKDHI